ncbi:MAG: HAMP domain-containing histidine kinase [Crocinitomicaceae bacterium]|nr:HAMP domain-containing histidine kinase [Crocinitomicaceae bacterium]MBK8924743.1 HAMP domain-containing histidine kinase [Crocinitomicaceae bacterium]
MSLAVLGLFFLQYGWINNVHELTEQKFGEDVKVALNKTALDLETYEMIQLANPEAIDEGLEGSLDDFVRSEFGAVIQSQESIAVRDTIIFKDGAKTRFLLVQGNLIDTATGLKAEHRVITKDLRGITPAEIDNSTLGLDSDTNSFAIQWNESFAKQINKKTYYLNYLIERMFTTNPVDDIALRLNLVLLDSLLAYHLNENKIDTSFRFNIISTQGREVRFKTGSKHFDNSLKQSEHTTLLYPNDVIPGEYLLLVKFPGQQFLVWKEMTGTLLASLALVIIVMLAFYFAVNTIFRQKQLSEIKNDFISNMTHELKTPIATISLACEAVRDPDLQNDRDTLNSFIGMIDQENKRLGKLVENVLQTALIDKGRLKLNLEECSVDDLLKQVVESFRIRYHDKGGEISIDKADIIVWRIDKMHFANVIYNLLDNSLKYCEEQPHVHISLEKKSGGFSLVVEDNGIGIKKEDQKRIFEKLYRVPTGDIHNVKGFGLGLSYVFSIVKLHNGTIDLKSALGKGSTFKITVSHE